MLIVLICKVYTSDVDFFSRSNQGLKIKKIAELQKKISSTERFIRLLYIIAIRI